LAPNCKGPAEIIDINDTNAKIKFGNKIKMLNIEKIYLICNDKNIQSENDTHLERIIFQ
jgi:hypothetical protein